MSSGVSLEQVYPVSPQISYWNRKFTVIYGKIPLGFQIYPYICITNRYRCTGICRLYTLSLSAYSVPIQTDCLFKYLIDRFRPIKWFTLGQLKLYNWRKMVSRKLCLFHSRLRSWRASSRELTFRMPPEPPLGVMSLGSSQLNRSASSVREALFECSYTLACSTSCANSGAPRWKFWRRSRNCGMAIISSCFFDCSVYCSCRYKDGTSASIER